MMSVPTTLKTLLARLAWGREVQGLDMNQIREAAMRIHPFHLGSTAIVIIIATNGAWKECSCDWNVRFGFIQGKHCNSCIFLLNLVHICEHTNITQGQCFVGYFTAHGGAEWLRWKGDPDVASRCLFTEVWYVLNVCTCTRVNPSECFGWIHATACQRQTMNAYVWPFSS